MTRPKSLRCRKIRMQKTEIIDIYDPERDRENIKRAAELLRQGALVAIPTETVYGLAANALDAAAVKRIFEAKGRPRDNPIIVHVADPGYVKELARDIPGEFYELAGRFWPGPLTIVMKASEKVPLQTRGGLDTVAVRMPSDKVANAIIKEAGVPLAAPSANLSGSPSPTTAQHCIDDLSGRVEAIVRSHDCTVGVESTVITLAEPVPMLLRPGAVTPDQLWEVLPAMKIHHAVTGRLEENEKAVSPGMKYRHYAPKASVAIVYGSLDAFCRFISERQREGLYAVVFDSEEEKVPCPCLTYGEKDHPAQQAKELFSVLRRLDELCAEQVFVRAPETRGVGLAVYNRLLRAAGFNEIYLEGDGSMKGIVIGLTGQTGAGKTTVSRMLSERGFAVVDADICSHRVTEKGRPCLKDIAGAFPENVITAQGELDRAALGTIVFNDMEKKKLLESIIFPYIEKEIADELNAAFLRGADAAVLDAPTLFESGADKNCNRIIAVTAPKDIRLKRIMERDGIGEAEALSRIGSQLSEEFYSEHADYIIENASDEKELERQVDMLSSRLKEYIAENRR